MLRKFGNYLLGKDSRASAAALIFSTLGFFGFPTSFLSLIILGLVSLVKGARSGLTVLAWAILPSLCMLYLQHWSSLELASIARCILVLVLALVFRARTSWRLVLECQALIGLLAVLGFHLIIRDASQWWAAILSSYFEKLKINEQLNIGVDQLQQFIQQVSHYATGLVAVGVMLGVFLLLILARWWQNSLVFRAQASTQEFAHISMSPWFAGLVLLAVLAWLLVQQAIILDSLPVLIFPFVIVGLSTLHYGMDRKKPKTLLGGEALNKTLRIVLFICYLGLIIAPWILGLVLALVGIIDSIYSVRVNVFDRKRVRA